MLTCDDYLSPRTLDEAFDAIDAHRGRFRLVAGATDILPWAREGRAGDVHIPVLIDVAGIPELKTRDVSPGRARLGAATPFQRFLDDADLARALPVLPRCAVWFADDQIRESATVGGNLVNASPAADGTPALLTNNAVVEIARRDNAALTRRTVPLSEFVTGPGKAAIGDDEILLSVTCEPTPGYGGAFEKVGHRRSLVISTVCVAALVRMDESGRIFDDVRLAVGGIGPVPRRLAEVEVVLRSKPLDSSHLERAAGMAPSFVASRTRQEYRHEVVAGFMVRSLVNAARRAGADTSRLAPELEATHA
ncbi:MAG: xanthine dehydrogenase family protein subunit M [Hyphomicrobiaceae bacterium]